MATLYDEPTIYSIVNQAPVQLDEGRVSMKCLIEAVACSVKDALTAQECGADRIELCSAIELGGLTPSIGLVQEVLATCNLPVMAMVRPRSGGFVYSIEELRTMERDVRALVSAGVHGVVFGVLDGEGRVDEAACARLGRTAGGVGTVFHRAFDVTPDGVEALDCLVELGFTRVLTAGHQERAIDGAPLIRELVARANQRIQVMAGGGVRHGNVSEVVQSSAVSQIHLGPFRKTADRPGLYGEGHLVLDANELRSTVEALAGDGDVSGRG